MSYLWMLGIIGICAYGLQFYLGLRQINHFNAVYKSLRQQGRVVIGRKVGRLRAGTIVLFLIDSEDRILACRLMQGVSVIAKFKDIPAYVGQDMHFIDRKHPLVQKENKLTQLAMENARDIFVMHAAGLPVDTQPQASWNIVDQAKLFLQQIIYKVKGVKQHASNR